jgi:hypothetical protein
MAATMSAHGRSTHERYELSGPGIADGCSSCRIFIRTFHAVPRYGSVRSVRTIVLRMRERHKPVDRQQDDCDHEHAGRTRHHSKVPCTARTAHQALQVHVHMDRTQVLLTMTDRPSLGFLAACARALFEFIDARQCRQVQQRPPQQIQHGNGRPPHIRRNAQASNYAEVVVRRQEADMTIWTT